MKLNTRHVEFIDERPATLGLPLPDAFPPDLDAAVDVLGYMLFYVLIIQLSSVN